MWPFTKKVKIVEFTLPIKQEISRLEEQLRVADLKSLPGIVTKYETRILELDKQGYNTQFPKYVLDCYKSRLDRGKK